MGKTYKSDWGSQDNIVLTLIRFSLPLILSGILQQLYNWADAFIVGQYVGEEALEEVGANSTITSQLILQNTGYHLGMTK